MHIRKVSLLVVSVSLCFVLVLVASAWGSDALAHPCSHTSDIQAAQCVRPEFIGCAGAPAYDSGWEVLGVRPDPISVAFTHNLGGNLDDYLVSLECRDDTSLGTYDCTDRGFKVNALWYGLTNTTIKVYATGGSLPDDVRVRIWRVHTVYLPVVMRGPLCGLEEGEGFWWRRLGR
jgi:hypothetical protein